MVSKVCFFNAKVSRPLLTSTQPKPSPAAAAGEGPSTPAKAAPAATPAAPAPAAAPAAPQVPTTPSPAAPATSAAEPPSFNDPSALAMGPQGEAAVAQMEAMGFPRSDIDRAMRAAFFNPDRAIEYLLNVSLVKTILKSDSKMLNNSRASQRMSSRNNSKQQPPPQPPLRLKALQLQPSLLPPQLPVARSQ